jgi:adenosyl cobinamide kinase/adenosyl cobinamide phosphate guanylyltransferase
MAMTLLIGGAASGKSRTAAALGAEHGGPVTVIATAEALDEEMSARIQRHRRDRPPSWTVVEEPLALADAIGSATGFVIVDCLTLWVSNLLGSGTDDDEVVSRAAVAAGVSAARPDPTVVITNEVGSGIVPMNPLARRYRDALGRVNATFADAAATVALMVAGRAVRTATTLTIEDLR